MMNHVFVANRGGDCGDRFRLQNTRHVDALVLSVHAMVGGRVEFESGMIVHDVAEQLVECM